MNELGKTGTRSVESKRAMAKEKKEREKEAVASEESDGGKTEDKPRIAASKPVFVLLLISLSICFGVFNRNMRLSSTV